MLQRTYNQEIMLRLGGVQVKQYHDTGEVFMINTPMTTGSEEYLIILRYVHVSSYFIKNNKKKFFFTLRKEFYLK